LILIACCRAAAPHAPTDLSSNATRDVAASSNLLLADAFALYIKTKNFRRRMSGPNFRDYHVEVARWNKISGRKNAWRLLGNSKMWGRARGDAYIGLVVVNRPPDVQSRPGNPIINSWKMFERGKNV
jgi:hypothetical protein